MVHLHSQSLKKLTMKEAVYWSAEAWEEATTGSLAKAWKKLLIPSVAAGGSTPSSTPDVAAGGSTPSEGRDIDSLSEFDRLFRDLGFNENDNNWLSPQDWLEQDTSDPGYQIMSEDEIVTTV